MQTSQFDTPRYPTRRQIERGIAEGRRAHAQAVGNAAKAVFDFLVGRKVKQIDSGGRVAPLTG